MSSEGGSNGGGGPVGNSDGGGGLQQAAWCPGQGAVMGVGWSGDSRGQPLQMGGWGRASSRPRWARGQGQQGGLGRDSKGGRG